MINLSNARPDQHPEILALYEKCGYHGGVAPGDFVLVAEELGSLVGAVRLCSEEGLTLLRGFFLLPTHHRRGLGSRMLLALLPHLYGRTCYCIPFIHLSRFYAFAGFSELPQEKAPEFLHHRLESYRSQGHKVMLMVRSGAV